MARREQVETPAAPEVETPAAPEIRRGIDEALALCARFERRFPEARRGFKQIAEVLRSIGA